MPNPQDSYQELISIVHRAALMGSCGYVLSWDRETYMPPGGNEHRAEQLSLLAGVAHEWSTDPRIGELLDVLSDSELTDTHDSDTACNIRQIRRSYNRARKLPQRLVEEST